ncbi:MAG: aldo/keto reductase [Candidatus Kerfeldbacteria bacterium]|nr:aldo/keto reductase [Candidatus Kerfeldbacteria bacterium]
MTQPTQITLNTGALMPIIGLGTWRASAAEVGPAVTCALLECGYRQIDCAHIYNNEKEIGQVFKKVFSGGQLRREEVFVTSKLWNTAHAPQDVKPACQNSLRDLGLDYLDLYLMHWGVAVLANLNSEPLDKNKVLITAQVSIRETWEAMEKLASSGLVKAIGVANFTGAMLLDLLSYARLKPAVNQIELHPYNAQSRLVEFCQAQGIAVTAYSPLGSPGNFKAGGKEPILLQDKTIRTIAQNHQKTPAQVLLHWAVQRQTIVIPKSVKADRLKSNIDIFDFVLSAEDMALILVLDKKLRYINPYDWWHLPYFD